MAKFYYGGQAVIEGVMMRGRKAVAMAVRRPNQSIYVHEEPLTARLYQNSLFRLPFLRGLLLLWDMLVLGTRLMTLSASLSMEEEQSEDDAQQEAEIAQKEATQLSGAALFLPLLVSLTLAVAIFFVGPVLVTGLLHTWIGNGWLSIVVEGVIRLALLIGYLLVIGRLPDVQRLFGYHGAEHKTINAMEQGDPLDVEHVRRASRVHTRCGTGFLLLVMVVSIFVFALIGSPALLIKIVARILLIPVVACVSYELMRLGAANYRFRVVRWLLAPGLSLQGLTTREPDDSMIECAIAALQRVLAQDERVEPVTAAPPDLQEIV